MLSRKYRLPAGIKLSNYKSSQSSSFMIIYIPNNLNLSRFGFIISKKVARRAVLRNRTKRLYRSVIEELLQKIVAGYDMLFIINKNALFKKRQLLQTEIETLFIEKLFLK